MDPVTRDPLTTATALRTLADAIGAFLQSRDAAGVTEATLRVYRANLERFTRAAGVEELNGLTTETVEGYLADLRVGMKPISVHQHYRTLRTFTRWLHRTGGLEADPMADVRMRLPHTLPRVPNDDAIRRLLAACDTSSEGRRNRALITLAADSGLRKEELRRLRVGDLDQASRTLRVFQGKGRKDGVGFFGEATASVLRAWLAAHPDPRPSCFVFITREGVPLAPSAFARILRRLSRRAGLERPVGPHALRHYAATAVWRRSGDLELVRRVLRHETLAMVLRYVQVSQADIVRKFAVASPMDHLNARKEAVRR